MGGGGDLRSAKLSPAFAQHRSFHYLVTYSRSSKRRFNATPTFWQSEFLKLGLHDLQATHVVPEGFSQGIRVPNAGGGKMVVNTFGHCRLILECILLVDIT